MVPLATLYWDQIQSLKRKHDEAIAPEGANKKPKTESTATPWGRGGYRGRNRGNRRGGTQVERQGVTQAKPEKVTRGEDVKARDSDGKVLICYCCGSWNHFVPECPEKAPAKVEELQGGNESGS
ncbi:uncharacterized protein BCR38DRAFT_404895 [Pseudomassariella vexata]|uniref:CCHC-type domain-containing protein n=1 Tax=Pseudomassariella vexata TaxID=1141098 RepID=A0A1Y2EJZ1_9PEZI|nr:uncharacterized protein BCR38DRAFT_404895 [Pseudomassariella vexata]ORY71861.1 hypothetical protein BCR38DRAFT_404895 [Pseudomassariella vexata]